MTEGRKIMKNPLENQLNLTKWCLKKNRLYLTQHCKINFQYEANKGW